MTRRARLRSTRRGLIGSSAAACANNTAVAASACSADADAELLAACREFERATARMDYLNAHAPDAPYDDPRTIAHEAAIDRASDVWFRAMRAVAAHPAQTPQGLRAKSKSLRHARRFEPGGDSEQADDLTDSLLADILRIPAA
jgi:hypothetical protein